MKVLVSKNAYPWSTETVCTGENYRERGCEDVLLVEEDDLAFHEGRDYNYITFTCPTCGLVQVIKDLSPVVMARVEAKSRDKHKRRKDL